MDHFFYFLFHNLTENLTHWPLSVTSSPFGIWVMLSSPASGSPMSKYVNIFIASCDCHYPVSLYQSPTASPNRVAIWREATLAQCIFWLAHDQLLFLPCSDLMPLHHSYDQSMLCSLPLYISLSFSLSLSFSISTALFPWGLFSRHAMRDWRRREGGKSIRGREGEGLGKSRCSFTELL